MMLRRWGNRLLSLLYPNAAQCLICGTAVQTDGLCEDCRSLLAAERLTEPLCQRCGYPLDARGGCDQCRSGSMPEARSVWRHQGAARALVHSLKFEGQRAPARFMAEAMAACVQPLLTEAAVVTWVPMPDKRFHERYYDHARLLAEGVAQHLALPVRQMLLRSGNSGDIRHQVGLNRAEREANLQGTFACGQGVSGVIILVDDVLTTGATARCCTECLLSGGAARVIVLTATRAVSEKTEGEPTHVSGKAGAAARL